MNFTNNCYLAEIIFRLHNKKQPGELRFDKCYFPIEAGYEKEAYQKALIIASTELDKRTDYTKTHLQWEFVGLEALNKIEKIATTAAYSKVMPPPKDLSRYVYKLKQQNAQIQYRLMNG